MFQLLDALLKSYDAIRLKDKGLCQVLGEGTVHHVLYLMQLERHDDIQFIQFLLLLKLLTQNII